MSEGERNLIGLFFDFLAEKGLPKQSWVVTFHLALNTEKVRFSWYVPFELKGGKNSKLFPMTLKVKYQFTTIEVVILEQRVKYKRENKIRKKSSTV